MTGTDLEIELVASVFVGEDTSDTRLLCQLKSYSIFVKVYLMAQTLL